MNEALSSFENWFDYKSQEYKEAKGDIAHLEDMVDFLLELCKQAYELQQAKIDALMLEYCPEEMTPEQIQEWARNQKSVDAMNIEGLNLEPKFEA